MTDDLLATIEARLKAATLPDLPGYEVVADGLVWSIASNHDYLLCD